MMTKNFRVYLICELKNFDKSLYLQNDLNKTRLE